MKSIVVAALAALSLSLFAEQARAAEPCGPQWYSSALCELPAVYWLTYTPPKQAKKPQPPRGSSPCETTCCHDAKITICIDTCRPCYTEQGLQSFAALFSAAAERGVENATIRAMNRIEIKPTDTEKK